MSTISRLPADPIQPMVRAEAAQASVLPPLIATTLLIALLVFSAGIVAWRIAASPADSAEPARIRAVWTASQAVTAYDRLREVIAVAQDPEAAGAVLALTRAFAEPVARLSDATIMPVIRGNPEIRALASRLSVDHERLPRWLRLIDDQSGSSAVAIRMAREATELERLAEVANDAGISRAERGEQTADSRREVLTGVIAVLVAVGLLSIVMLARNTRELHATRRALEDAGSRLRQALDDARHAGEAKSDFIAAASEGIRAALNEVTSLVDTLPAERSIPARTDLAGQIRAAGGNLTRVLDDIQDYAELEAGHLTLRLMRFSPEAVTASAVAGIEVQARAKGLTIVAIPSPGLPKVLMGDAGRIGQILFNLVSNAVKFTSKGGITVQVLCLERRPGFATIEWVVTDTGIGIDPARIAGLSKATVAGTATGRHGGTGFGLAICEHLVARMDGRLRVESALGQGSRFRVRVTFGVAPNGALDARAEPASATPLRAWLRAMGRRPLVLIAEDTPGGQFILRQLLAREGIAPKVVPDGRAAVLAAELERYDVICMDLRMPELDGLEATRRIRSGRGLSASTPIIAVTASVAPADMQACLDAGMTMFVPKPVGRERFLHAILTALTGSPAEAGQPVVVEARQSAA